MTDGQTENTKDCVIQGVHISTPGLDETLIPALLLAHIDGETRLNTNGMWKQKIFNCQACGVT